MNHRPFEDWLLDDQPLTSQQERDLQAHLRSCTVCTSIAESNLALHSTHAVAPSAGFSSRFSVRLSRWQHQQRLRQILGTMVLVLGGLGVLTWLTGPTIQHIVESPAAWITASARYLVFGLTSFRVLSGIGLILVRDLPSFVPPVAWWFVFLLTFALVVIWILAARRSARAPQGVGR